MLTIHRSGSPLPRSPGDLVALDPGVTLRSVAASTCRSGRRGQPRRRSECSRSVQNCPLPPTAIRSVRPRHPWPGRSRGRRRSTPPQPHRSPRADRPGRSRPARTPCFLEHARKQGAVVEPNLRTPPTIRRDLRRGCCCSRVGSAPGRRVRYVVRTTHCNLSVYWRVTLLPGPPHGVKMNRALTRRWPSRLRILSPALVGLSVIRWSRPSPPRAPTTSASPLTRRPDEPPAFQPRQRRPSASTCPCWCRPAPSRRP